MHTDAVSYRSSYFGQGTGHILLDSVSCTGSEDHLLDCLNDGLNVHDCTHHEDASVTCCKVFVC